MRQPRALACITIALLILGSGFAVGCQGAPLSAAVPAQPLARPSAPTPRADPAAAFAEFLGTGPERGAGRLLDRDGAMRTILSAQARAKTPRRERLSTDACSQTDYLDAFARERGISREHARLIYKNKKYEKPAEAKK